MTEGSYLEHERSTNVNRTAMAASALCVVFVSLAGCPGPGETQPAVPHVKGDGLAEPADPHKLAVRVQAGMGESEVTDILGEPHWTFVSDYGLGSYYRVWHWDYPEHCLSVVFAGSSRVTSVRLKRRAEDPEEGKPVPDWIVQFIRDCEELEDRGTDGIRDD